MSYPTFQTMYGQGAGQAPLTPKPQGAGGMSPTPQTPANPWTELQGQAQPENPWGQKLDPWAENMQAPAPAQGGKK